MENIDLKNNVTQLDNTVLDGIVQVLKTPINERYCRVGDIAILDLKNKMIRCSGAWFKFDERWSVKNMDLVKCENFIQLQKLCNKQLEEKGEINHKNADELEVLADSLNEVEIEWVCKSLERN